MDYLREKDLLAKARLSLENSRKAGAGPTS
jgi:hypothetical protein